MELQGLCYPKGIMLKDLEAARDLQHFCEQLECRCPVAYLVAWQLA